MYKNPANYKTSHTASICRTNFVRLRMLKIMYKKNSQPFDRLIVFPHRGAREVLGRIHVVPLPVPETLEPFA